MVPNLLSLTRLLLGLSFPWLPERWRLWVFLAAAFSDLLDGFTSRLLKVDNGNGRYLDPIADKVFILGVILTLTVEGVVTIPEVVLLGLRDLAVVTGIAVLFVQGKMHRMPNLSPSLLGKMTTGVQFLCLLVLLLRGGWPRAIFWLAVVLSGVAAIDYVRRYLTEQYLEARCVTSQKR
jgi:phosphatidylglycerophosphate synthase